MVDWDIEVIEGWVSRVWSVDSNNCVVCVARVEDDNRLTNVDEIIPDVDVDNGFIMRGKWGRIRRVWVVKSDIFCWKNVIYFLIIFNCEKFNLFIGPKS